MHGEALHAHLVQAQHAVPHTWQRYVQYTTSDTGAELASMSLGFNNCLDFNLVSGPGHQVGDVSAVASTLQCAATRTNLQALVAQRSGEVVS